MRMQGLLHTWWLFFDKWAELRTGQIVENSHHRPQKSLPVNIAMFCQQHTKAPCHCYKIMWAIKNWNIRISTDIVTRFLQPSVGSAQIEKCAQQRSVMPAKWSRSKGARRGLHMHPLFPNSAPKSFISNQELFVFFTILVLGIILVRLLV